MAMTWKLGTQGNEATLELRDTDQPAKAVKDLLAEINGLKAARLLVTLNSAACSPEAGLEIYAALRRWPGRVVTYTTFAANGGVLVALAADAENRLVSGGAVIVLQPGTIWKIAGIDDIARSLRSSAAATAGVLADRVGRWDAQTWDVACARQVSFDAENAVYNGLASAIVSEAEAQRWDGAKSQAPRPRATARPREAQVLAKVGDRLLTVEDTRDT